LYDYTNPRYGVDPTYGPGCYYDLIARAGSGYPIGTVIPNWFAQNWVNPVESCLDGYTLNTNLNPHVCQRADPSPKPPCPDCNGDSANKTTANPVRLGTGEKTLAEADMPALSSGLGLTRTYRSRSVVTAKAQPLVGAHWQAPYQQRLIYSPAITGAPAAAAVPRPDGSTFVFRLNVSGQWQADVDVVSSLTETVNGAGQPTAWTYTTPEGDVEVFDGTGRLTSITTRTGRTQTITYSTAPSGAAPWPGLAVAVTDSFGRVLGLSYDSWGRLSQVTDPAGATYQYQYDNTTNNSLISVTYPDSNVRQYVYNESAHTGGYNFPTALTGVIDENAVRYATYDYNLYGIVAAEQRAGGVDKFQFAYAVPLNAKTTVTDPLGTPRVHQFSMVLGVVRPTSLDQPCTNCGGAFKAFAYDANGNVTSRTDFNSKQVCYAYDTTRNLETARAEGILSTETCSAVLATLPSRADVRKVSTQWHALWRLPIKVAEPNRLTTNAYNGDGGAYCAPTTALVNGNPIGVLCSRTVQETTDATGQQGFAATTTGSARVWQYTYDAFGQMLTATDPNSKTTTTAYYAATDPDLGKRGNVQTITNPLGHVTTVTAYDLNGRPTSITDPNGMVTTLTYWSRGWLHTRTVGGETTTYDYDAAGQLTKVTLPDASYLQYTYDGAHRLTQIQDGLGNKIIYTLDAMGNRVKEQAYDPSSQLARIRQQVYDSLNRLHQSVGAQ